MFVGRNLTAFPHKFFREILPSARKKACRPRRKKQLSQKPLLSRVVRNSSGIVGTVAGTLQPVEKERLRAGCSSLPKNPRQTLFPFKVRPSACPKKPFAKNLPKKTAESQKILKKSLTNVELWNKISM